MKKVYFGVLFLICLQGYASEEVLKPMQVRDLSAFPLASMFYHDLYKKSLDTRERLLAICNAVGSKIKGAEVIVPSLKSFGRTKDKVDLDYSGDWKKVTDIVRGSISFQTLDDLKKGVFLFNEKLPLQGIKDRIWMPTPSGYIDILALFKDPENNVIGEIQFHLCHILNAKEEAHALYEQIQAIERRTVTKKREFNSREKTRMDELKYEAENIYKDALRRIENKMPCSIKVNKSKL